MDLGGDTKTVSLAVILYISIDLIRWMVKRVMVRGQRDDEIYKKERELLHEIRNTLQVLELKSVEMNKRIIDKLTDIVDDLRIDRGIHKE